MGGQGNALVVLHISPPEPDRVRLELPMPVRVQTWEAQQNAVSICRGPLAFSIKIKEKYVEHDGTEYAQEDVPQEVAKRWPVWEIEPASAWNYGLVGVDYRIKLKPGRICTGFGGVASLVD